MAKVKINHVEDHHYHELIPVFTHNQAAKLDKYIKFRVVEIGEEIKKEFKIEDMATKKEFGELKDIVKELAEAQKETQLEFKKLMEAHNETQIELNKLFVKVVDVDAGLTETRCEVGGLSTNLGYILENEAYKVLPKLLLRDFGVKVKGRLLRKYITTDRNESFEVNIFGEAVKSGKKIIVLGESKSKLSKNDIDKFLRKQFNKLSDMFDNPLLILVTHNVTSNDVVDYANEKSIKIYFSYEF